MTWDVMLTSTRDKAPPPLGEVQTVRESLARAHPQIRWRRPSLGVLKGWGWSMELDLGEKDPVEVVWLSVSGLGTPRFALARLCRNTGWHALDMQSVEYIEVGAALSTWAKFV